jgi:GH25 family lysozyme M1 (1,4-beta-N-acetylmuramidase)
MNPMLGVDISQYQKDFGPEHFDALVAGGIGFAMFRASIGVRDDTEYARFVGLARERGLVTGAYHYMTQYPAELPAERQAEVFIQQVQSNPVDILFLDLEETGIGFADTLRFVERFRRDVLDGTPISLYSRWSWLDTRSWVATALPMFEGTWMAHYGSIAKWPLKSILNGTLTLPEPPASEKGSEVALLHQFTDNLRFSAKGRTWGCDGDAFRGTQRDMLRAFGALP